MYAWEFGEARQQTLTAQWTDDGACNNLDPR